MEGKKLTSQEVEENGKAEQFSTSNWPPNISPFFNFLSLCFNENQPIVLFVDENQTVVLFVVKNLTIV